MPQVLKGWEDWRPRHLVDDTLADPTAEHLAAYMEWAFQDVKPDRYKLAINKLYSWCYTYAESLEGIDLVMFNKRFKKAAEEYLKRDKLDAK